MGFKKGQSGNPKGRPKDATLAEVRSAALSKSPWAIGQLVKIARGTDKGAAVQALKAILDRGCGKPRQEITGADGGPLTMELVDARAELQRRLGRLASGVGTASVGHGPPAGSGEGTSR